jgi:hypothetical protein
MRAPRLGIISKQAPVVSRKGPGFTLARSRLLSRDRIALDGTRPEFDRSRQQCDGHIETRATPA